jgi:hypothetical protein
MYAKAPKQTATSSYKQLYRAAKAIFGRNCIPALRPMVTLYRQVSLKLNELISCCPIHVNTQFSCTISTTNKNNGCTKIMQKQAFLPFIGKMGLFG